MKFPSTSQRFPFLRRRPITRKCFPGVAVNLPCRNDAQRIVGQRVRLPGTGFLFIRDARRQTLERVCHQNDIPPLVLILRLVNGDMETGGQLVVSPRVIVYQVTASGKGEAAFQTDFQSARDKFRDAEITGNGFSFPEGEQPVIGTVQLE